MLDKPTKSQLRRTASLSIAAVDENIRIGNRNVLTAKPGVRGRMCSSSSIERVR
jgi:hypothetical protein